MAKRKQYEVTGKGKWNGKALSSMRNTAFSMKTVVATSDIIRRAEYGLRDDDALIAAAEEKRRRKAAKRASKVK